MIGGPLSECLNRKANASRDPLKMQQNRGVEFDRDWWIWLIWWIGSIWVKRLMR